MKLLVTGGAGFIGSNFIHHILKKYPDYHITNLDKLTYAGNLENLKDVEKDKRYSFIRGDICNKKDVEKASEDVDMIINFAAETHVDRSIEDPDSFIKTDILGTKFLLEKSKEKKIKFIQISTDEVYGSIEKGSFKETDQIKPSSPYSASKSGGELLAYSYYKTYSTKVITTRSSNNFGPYQYPEKLIPLFITNLLEDKQVPVYGDGLNLRDWIYVIDNCEAIDVVMHKGKIGEIYNIGAGNEKTNIDITKKIINLLGKDDSSIQFVKDRQGHDRRYSLDITKIKKLGWKPRYDFDESLKLTIEWYKTNINWWKKIKSGAYLEYYRRLYKERHGMK